MSVRKRSKFRTVQHRNLKLGVWNLCNNDSDKFEGQGHRSKVKVTRSKNVISRLLHGNFCV